MPNLKRIFRGPSIKMAVLDELLAGGEFTELPWYKMASESERPRRWRQGPYFCKVADDDTLTSYSTVVVGELRRKGFVWGFVGK